MKRQSVKPREIAESALRRASADGVVRISTIVAALADTNILVYRYDGRDPRKQHVASDLLRQGIADRSVVIAHQAVIEFYAAVTRPSRGGRPILDRAEATRETEELLATFDVIYPSEELVRAALRATAAYELSWFDALMWAYADTNGLDEILSEDFQSGRTYGRVKITNPFV
jgi:predicted nucleic acid-binding protein